jgi:hypothetical protein
MTRRSLLLAMVGALATPLLSAHVGAPVVASAAGVQLPASATAGVWFDEAGQPVPPAAVGVIVAANDPVLDQTLLLTRTSAGGIDLALRTGSGQWSTAPYVSDFAAIESMTYDPVAGGIVAYGWCQSAGPCIRWWRGTSWSSPVLGGPNLLGPAMAYDAATGEVVLYGGGYTTGAPSTETWTWDGAAWTHRQPLHNPGWRVVAGGMASDTTRGTVVVVAGNDGGCDPTFACGDQTWLWNSSDWTLAQPTVHPPVSVNSERELAEDPVTGRVLLVQPGSGIQSTDSWAWDGVNWEPQPQTSGPVQVNAMVFDADDQGIMTVGDPGVLIPGALPNPINSLLPTDPNRAVADLWVFRTPTP